jgi:hypothetical protein
VSTGDEFGTEAVHETVTSPSPATTRTEVGGFGATAGVTAFEATEAGDEPYGEVATTVKVYVVPFVKPLTVHVVAPVVEHVKGCAIPLIRAVTA